MARSSMRALNTGKAATLRRMCTDLYGVTVHAPKTGLTDVAPASSRARALDL